MELWFGWHFTSSCWSTKSRNCGVASTGTTKLIARTSRDGCRGCDRGRDNCRIEAINTHHRSRRAACAALVDLQPATQLQLAVQEGKVQLFDQLHQLLRILFLAGCFGKSTPIFDFGFHVTSAALPNLGVACIMPSGTRICFQTLTARNSGGGVPESGKNFPAPHSNYLRPRNRMRAV